MIPTAVFGYRDTYGLPIPEDHFALLRAYPTDLIVMEVAKINSLLFHVPHDNKKLHQQVFSKVFPQLDTRRRNAIANVLAKEVEDDYWPQFFASPPLSELLRDSFSNFNFPPRESMVDTVQFQQDLWDSILIYNQLYYVRVADHADLNNYETQWKIGLMQQAYIRLIDYISLTGPTKVLLFYKFLKIVLPDGPALIQEFVNATGTESFFDYTLFSGSVISKSLSSYDKDQEIKWNLNLSDQQQKMLRQFSFRHGDFVAGKKINVHMDIMTHPLYYLMDEHPVILDFHYLNYVAELSLIYNFYQLTSLNKSNEYPNFTSFKAMLGKDYYESFVTGEILRSIYSKKGYEFYDDTTPGFPDFSASWNGKDIFLFEVKSSEVNMKVADELNMAEMKKFLDEQLANPGQHRNSRKKGIYQLLTCIDQLAHSAKLDILLGKSPGKSKATIYPIVIYTDPVLDIPCTNSYLRDIFQREIEPYKPCFKKIFPVTLINQSSLIDKYDLLKNDPKLLKTWIETFSKRTESNFRSYLRDRNVNQFLKAGISFTFFLHEFVPARDSIPYFRKIVDDLQLAHEGENVE